MTNIKDWKLWLAAIIAFMIIVVGFFIFAEGAKHQYLNRDGIEVPDDAIADTTEETIEDSPSVVDSSREEMSGESQSIVDSSNSISQFEETLEAVDTYEDGLEPQNTDFVMSGYYDIPLCEEDQDLVFGICEQYGIQPEVIFAIMFVESRFNPNTVGYSGELGYMQILPSTGAYVLSALEIGYSWDIDSDDYIGVVLSDAKTNIECSAYLIQQFLARYGSINQALMCYNSGEGRAQALWSEGIYDTYYSTEVLNVMAQLVKK